MYPRLRHLVRCVAPRGAATDGAVDGASIAAAAYPQPSEAEAENKYQTGHALMSDILREDLADKPRIDADITAWSVLELLDRARGLGARDAQLNSCVLAGDPRADLLALVRSLEPPPPSVARVEDFTVPRTASVGEVVARLDRFGACVIERCAEEALVAQVEADLEPWGAWSKEASDRAEGSRGGRMGMNGLVHAPVCEHLLTHPTVLAAVNSLLGRSCRRIALKEIEIFAVQPGQGKQPFHREDQFWPWHHEPHPWAVSVLWAIDDFTPENGGTRLFPFSHRGRVREGGREMMEGTYDEAEVCKLCMPRGSVLIFVGGMVHAGGTNTTAVKRKSFLTGYQLGWLRPENKFWAYQPLHDKVLAGGYSEELARLLGHGDRSAKNRDWSGDRGNGAFNGRRADQVHAENEPVEGVVPKRYLNTSAGYEAMD
jgi:ectoine hydroxylase-related dioxygenase (phytanoyl-CoA dioxygenase family)